MSRRKRVCAKCHRQIRRRDKWRMVTRTRLMIFDLRRPEHWYCENPQMEPMRVKPVFPDAHLGAPEDPDSILGHGI